MTFRLSKVARCKPRKPQDCDTNRIRKKDQTHTGSLLEKAKALPSVPSSRRRRRPIPIPTFSPIDSYCEDEKIDLSIFDTPPAKKKKVWESEGSLKRGEKATGKINIQTAVETHDIQTMDLESNEVGIERKTPLSVINSYQNQYLKEQEIPKGVLFPITIGNDQSTAQTESQLTLERPPNTCSIKTNPTSNTLLIMTSIPKLFRNSQPNQTALNRSVDTLLKQVDIALVTLKDIREAIETEYDVKLNKANKNLIKDRLSNIINGKVQPMPHNNESQGKNSTMSETSHSNTTSIPFLNVPPKISVVQSEAATSHSQLSNAKNPDQSTFLATSTVCATKSLHSVQGTETSMERPTPNHQLNPSPSQEGCLPFSVLEPATVNKSDGHIYDSTELVALEYIRSVHDKATEESILENTTVTGMSVIDIIESEDDHEIPSPALSKPLANPVLSRNRIRKISRTKIKGLPATSISLTLGVPPQRATRRNARKGSCALCITCPCQNERTEAVDSSPAFALAWNDKEIEKALIRRVKKLEKTCDKYEGDLDQVNRELKRRRKALMKQQEALVSQMRQQKIGDSHFLPDANMWQHHLDEMKQTRLQREVVQQAKSNLFSFHPNFQPTLTQMLGVRSNKTANEDKESDDKATAIEGDVIEASGEVENSYSIDDAESVVNHYGTIEDESVTCHVHRLKWNNQSDLPSTQSPLLSRTGQGIWGALKPLQFSEKCSDKYVCAWDQVFLEEDLAEEGIEELLDLFEHEVGNPQQSNCREPLRTLIENSLVDLSMLSQPSQQVAKSIESKIIADAEKHAMVEHVCPNWKENVRYALYQHDEVDIGSALEQIRQSRTRMDSRKEQIMAAWKRQQVVLDIYEMSLTESLKRLEEKKIVAPLASQGFFVADHKDSDCQINRSSVGPASEVVNPYEPLSPIDECLSEDNYHSKEVDTQNDNELLSCPTPLSQVPCR